MIDKIIYFFRGLKEYFFPKIHPFGKKIHASKDYYLDLFIKIKNKNYPKIEEFEKNKNFVVEKSWLDNLALHTQIVKKESNINYQHGRILYYLLYEHIDNNNLDNVNILEVGTARGFSAISMSKAINDNHIQGIVFSIDIISSNKKIIWNCIDDHEGLKTRYELLSNWKKELKNLRFLHGPSIFTLSKLNKIDRIHFAFLDGMHDYLNVKKEFNFVANKQIKGDIIVLDDYNIKFPGVVKFIDEVKNLKIYNIDILSSDSFRSYAICKKK